MVSLLLILQYNRNMSNLRVLKSAGKIDCRTNFDLIEH